MFDRHPYEIICMGMASQPLAQSYLAGSAALPTGQLLTAAWVRALRLQCAALEPVPLRGCLAEYAHSYPAAVTKAPVFLN